MKAFSSTSTPISCVYNDLEIVHHLHGCYSSAAQGRCYTRQLFSSCGLFFSREMAPHEILLPSCWQTKSGTTIGDILNSSHSGGERVVNGTEGPLLEIG
jgi:hypothetical protein